LLTESSMSVRIIVADDDAVVRQGTRRILETRPEWEICGEAEKPTYAY
jgi:DNA-binding NarL/FixJ family response regulator